MHVGERTRFGRQLHLCPDTTNDILKRFKWMVVKVSIRVHCGWYVPLRRGTSAAEASPNVFFRKGESSDNCCQLVKRVSIRQAYFTTSSLSHLITTSCRRPVECGAYVVAQYEAATETSSTKSRTAFVAFHSICGMSIRWAQVHSLHATVANMFAVD
jgi:hypothetical protein